VQLLGWLAWDGASVTFQHLAYLTINSSALTQAALKVQRPLVLDVHIGDPPNNEFMIPVCEAQIVNIKIDWGDGKENYVKQSRDTNKGKNGEPLSWHILHTYANEGEYVVRVSPADLIGAIWLDHLGFGESMPKHTWWRPLRAVRSLGALGIRSLSGLFSTARGFNLPLSHLDMCNITDLSFMFSGAASFNQPVENWNVSNVTNMRCMFSLASNFNQPLDGWDVGKVEDMCRMFAFAQSFNQPINSWNVSRVTKMECMFVYARSFDQPVGDWDVGQVVTMGGMFYGAISFNQPLCNWNVSRVSNMPSMFFDAKSFSQDLSSWDVSNVEDMRTFFNGDLFNHESISSWKCHPGEENSDTL
jgi:surface protein